MLLTNPYYSILYEYVTKKGFSQSGKCEYKNYDKAKDIFVYFNCFDIKGVDEVSKLAKENYEGSLEFSYNQATNEVYVSKVPYVVYQNIKVPVLTGDIVQIILDKLQKYTSSDMLKIVFADSVLPLAIDERATELLPALKETSNYRFLLAIINKITEEKKHIMAQTKRFQESQARNERSRERAIAKKRKILGLDPKDFPTTEEFQSKLREKITATCQYKLDNITRHLEANIKKYKKYFDRKNQYAFEYILRVALLDKIKQTNIGDGFLLRNIDRLYDPFQDTYYLESFVSDAIIPTELQRLVKMWKYFLDTDNKNLNPIFINEAINAIIDVDLHSPNGIVSAYQDREEENDLKYFAHEDGISYAEYCPYIIHAQVMRHNSGAEMHPVYSYYYKRIMNLPYRSYFDIARAMDGANLEITPLEIIVQIAKLEEKQKYYERILANPDEVVLKFYKTSKIWGSIMQLPYWDRVYFDPVFDADLHDHESFSLFMVRPGVSEIDYESIIDFVDNPKYKSAISRNDLARTNRKLRDRLMVMIPKSLSSTEITKLIDYAHEYGAKLNFVCENSDTSIIVKKVLLQKTLESYINGDKYFKEWCFINVDPNYYESFLKDTPNNKTLWHRYDYSSDYIYKRKELLSFDRQVELAIEYAQNGPNSIDYQLLDTILFGSYDSSTIFLEDFNYFQSMLGEETAYWEEELAYSRARRLKEEIE